MVQRSQLLIKKLSERYNTVTITLYSNLVGFWGLLTIAPFTESSIMISRDTWPWIQLIVTAIVMNGICTLIWNHQIQIVGASKASMFLNLEPFVAMVVGLLILNNSVSWSQLMGGIFIIIGVFLSTSLKWKKVIEKPIYKQKTENY